MLGDEGVDELVEAGFGFGGEDDGLGEHTVFEVAGGGGGGGLALRGFWALGFGSVGAGCGDPALRRRGVRFDL